MTNHGLQSARVYDQVRTAHLERLGHARPAVLLFSSTRYDFDLSSAPDDVAIVPLSRFGVIGHLLRTPYRVVEVAEPAIVSYWPDLAMQLAAIRIRSVLSRSRTRVVTYCIGIADPALEVRTRYRLPPRAARALTTVTMRAAMTAIDRVSFGTSGSRQMYTGYVGRRAVRGSQLFEAVPSPCECLAAADEPRVDRALFVGAFEPRKGIEQLMAAWDARSAQSRPATLTLVGKGTLTPEVSAWAASHDDVELVIDPPRSRIHQLLRTSRVVVLLSQPWKHWREQIGLSILEGLSHGCEIVTTTETGLADWLEQHGHDVIAPDAQAAQVAATIDAAIDRAASRRGSLDVLPAIDQRIAADHWMMD